MVKDAEINGLPYNGQKNMIQELQKVGLFIRKTRIDELPQLLKYFKRRYVFCRPVDQRESFFIMSLIRLFQNLRIV